MDSDGSREEVAGHDAVAVGCARRCAGSAWPAGSAVRAEVGSGDRPGCDAGGSERSESDLALGSPAAAGSTAAVRDRERAISLPRQLSLLLPGPLDADALAATLGRYARGEAG